MGCMSVVGRECVSMSISVDELALATASGQAWEGKWWLMSG